jgi:hypothetical protein
LPTLRFRNTTGRRKPRTTITITLSAQNQLPKCLSASSGPQTRNLGVARLFCIFFFFFLFFKKKESIGPFLTSSKKASQLDTTCVRIPSCCSTLEPARGRKPIGQNLELDQRQTFARGQVYVVYLICKCSPPRCWVGPSHVLDHFAQI